MTGEMAIARGRQSTLTYELTWHEKRALDWVTFVNYLSLCRCVDVVDIGSSKATTKLVDPLGVLTQSTRANGPP